MNCWAPSGIAGKYRASDLLRKARPLSAVPGNLHRFHSCGKLCGQRCLEDPFKWKTCALRTVFPLAAGWKCTESRNRVLFSSGCGNFDDSFHCRKIISVGAYDSRQNAYADFSGRGSQFLPIRKPDLAAPGVSISAPFPGGSYATVTGTSFAAPFVSGSAALLMEWGIVKGMIRFFMGKR